MRNSITIEKQKVLLDILEEAYPEKRDVDGLCVESNMACDTVVRNLSYLKERGFVEGEIKKTGDVWLGKVKITAQGIDFLKRKKARGTVVVS
jgi:predicted transcriptional regulator